jgi:hypothetical protein
VEQFTRAVDDYILRRVDARDLPMIAAQALARGVDSPALRELAGLGRADARDAADLLTRALQELGRPLRGPQQVRWDRARRLAGDVVAGALSAADGAERIAALLCEADHRDDHGRACDLATRFEMLSLDWDDYPGQRPTIVEEIRAAAADLLCEEAAATTERLD